MENENQEPLANQTQFALEEAAKELPVLELHQSKKTATEVRSPNRKLLLVLGVALLFGFLLLLVLLMPKQTAPLPESLLPVVSPVVNTTANPELELRINELQTDLSEADPAKNGFNFPLVDLELRLEQER